VFGAPTNCADTSTCTVDSCNPTTGACVHSPTGTGCNTCEASECGISLPAGQTCHCDSACQSFNDCCAGVGPACGFWDGNTSCEPWECGSQGGASPSCYCDAACVSFGDCCTGGPC
jgi:hypothetical protein